MLSICPQRSSRTEVRSGLIDDVIIEIKRLLQYDNICCRSFIYVYSIVIGEK